MRECVGVGMYGLYAYADGAGVCVDVVCGMWSVIHDVFVLMCCVLCGLDTRRVCLDTRRVCLDTRRVCLDVLCAMWS
jgi:hypothetical protein